jgi:hypothetical protein
MATEESAFLAPKHLRLPFLLAIWTAQRQGDLLRLPWSAYDGPASASVRAKPERM